MTPQRWQHLDFILDAILDVPPAEREAKLQALCKGDDELRREAQALLAATEADSRFISQPLADMAQAFEDTMVVPVAAASIGVYKIVREIGRGGMGVVYLAERDDGEYQQQVAIKIVGFPLLPGSNVDLIQRFRQERQILASLNHPHIARLVDGGTTLNGLPYVVMEYVAGVPLQEYCEQQNLSLRARLRLFQKVCEAVQFAHQKLIIHRDLKPSNILVNQNGEVKLLDFGIAKLLQTEMSDVAVTQTLPLVTPAFASPEQLRGEPISTATDVYALGLILYELLTGQPAYQLANLSITGIIRVVCEELPQRPSLKVKQHKDAGLSWQSEKLSIKLAGDIDTILLTALQKEPEQRYASVAQFSDDIERYLSGRPLQARAATWSYRARKFVRRNAKAVIAVGLLLISILAGIFSTLRQTYIAQELAQSRRRTIYTTQMNLASQAWETNNLTRLRELLVGHFPASGEEDLRGFEWYYFWRLLTQNGQLFSLAHPKGVISAAYSPDGLTIATACEDYHLRLWNAANGQLTATLAGHTDFVNQVVFSGDGKKLISSSSDKTIKIWDIAQQRELLTLRGHTAKVNRAIFTPDGAAIVSCADDGTWKKWDALTGAQIFSVNGPGQLMRAIAISPNGKLVATGGTTSSVNLWDAHNGQKISFVGQQEKWQCWSVGFSADGKLLAAGGINSLVKVWQLETKREIAALPTHAMLTHEVAFAPDGKTIAVTSDKSITTVWNVQQQKMIGQLKGHTNDVFCVAWSPARKNLLTASLDKTARVWNVTEILSNFDQEPRSSANEMTSYSPDLTECVRGDDQRSIILEDIATRSVQRRFVGHQGYITKIIFSPDGQRLASGGTDHSIKVWDKITGREIFSSAIGNSEITALQFSRNGKLLCSGSSDQVLRVLDAVTGQTIFTSETLSGFINKITTTADDSVLATASYDAQVRLWDMRNWKIIQTLTAFSRPVSLLAFAPQGDLLATGGEDDVIKIWSVPSGRLVSTIQGFLGHLSALSFSPDGKRLAVATSDGFVGLWEPTSHSEIFSSKRHQSPVFHLAFSADGNTLISGDSKGIVHYWRAASSQEVKIAAK